MHRLRYIFALATAAAFVPAAVAESYTVYLHREKNTPELRGIVQKLLPDTATGPADCRYVELSDTCSNIAEAEAQAAAMEAGVTHLPSLVVADEAGAYASLPLYGLKKKDIENAVEKALTKERENKAEQRRFQARVFLLYARCSFDMSAEELAEMVHECRMLMEHELCTKSLCQKLGLQCLYPLLMREYTMGYKGAHTPATEAKLLEAIAALEAARDLAPDTALGKKAHDERYRLRMARREARKYE